MVVEKAVADGLGLDIDVKNSQGVLVVTFYRKPCYDIPAVNDGALSFFFQFF